MLSFSSDKEFFNFLLTDEFREGQYSEGEILYMLKRFREEYRKIEGMKRSLERDLTNQQKITLSYDQEIEDLKKEINFLKCKNTILLDKFKNGLSFWERLTGRVKYQKDSLKN